MKESGSKQPTVRIMVSKISQRAVTRLFQYRRNTDFLVLLFAGMTSAGVRSPHTEWV